MNNYTTTDTYDYNWKEEVYNEATDEFEVIERQTYITVEIDKWEGEQWSDLDGGSPGGIGFDIVEWSGDDLSDDFDENKFFDWVHENM
jgi:hypothetical protein